MGQVTFSKMTFNPTLAVLMNNPPLNYSLQGKPNIPHTTNVTTIHLITTISPLNFPHTTYLKLHPAEKST